MGKKMTQGEALHIATECIAACMPYLETEHGCLADAFVLIQKMAWKKSPRGKLPFKIIIVEEDKHNENKHRND